MKTRRSIVTLALTLVLTAYVQGQEENGRLRTQGRMYEPLIAASAARYGIDPHLLWTIAYLESRFKPFAVSYKDGKPCARGLMQFIPATAREYGLRDPHSVPAAVDAAARYLRDLLRRFDGRGDLVLAAYNAGEGTIDAYRDGRRLILPGGKVINPNAVRTGGVPPYRETQQYVLRGIRIYQSIRGHGFFPAKTNTLQSDASLSSRPGRAEASIYVLNLSLSQARGDRTAKSKQKKSETL